MARFVRAARGHDTQKKRVYVRKRVCRFCQDQNLVINYKDPKLLKHFITERGKIMPRRMTGTCAKHQRKLKEAIMMARHIAFLPFTTLSG
ncbi:MAG: 30S ribosomal protein S18 [Proteobacteria bacterium]|jgi:small subunit ribosomal protein S18|nr:30S ribosomal protein S18 [Pseudomonadota bacterium]